MSKRSRRPRRLWSVIGPRLPGTMTVSAKSRGSAVHLAYRQWKEIIPQTSWNGWFKGVSCEVVPD